MGGRRAAVAPDRHPVQVHREPRPSQPVERRAACEPVHLEIHAHAKQRRIDDPANPPRHRVVRCQRLRRISRLHRRIDAREAALASVGDAQREHGTPLGVDAQPTRDAATPE
jgi:hypothetical protein